MAEAQDQLQYWQPIFASVSFFFVLRNEKNEEKNSSLDWISTSIYSPAYESWI